MANYYETLELKRTATNEEIANAYRRLALKYHPKRNDTDIATNTYKFNQIAEAYDVLKDPGKKAIYDQYGEIVLKEGLPGKDGKDHCYHYAGNALEIFEKFFGTDNPFIDIVDRKAAELEGSILGAGYGGAGQRTTGAPEDLTVTCECTLEELYFGCMKKLGYERTVLGIDGRSEKRAKEFIEVEINPGQASSHVIKFPGKGNEGYSYPTSDLLVKIVELPHERYKRKGNDLIYVQKLSLYDALCMTPFDLETLDHRVITVSADQIINPKYKLPIGQEGMPIFKEDPLASLKKEKEKGTLWILFDIKFPTYLSEDKKLKLREILQ